MNILVCFTIQKHLFIYSVNFKSTGRERENHQIPTKLELGQAEMRSQELNAGLPHLCRDPNTWTVVCCFETELETEAGLYPRYAEVGYRHPKRYFNPLYHKS